MPAAKLLPPAVDEGWIRVFGGGSAHGDDDLPSLAEVNLFPAVFDPGWDAASDLIAGPARQAR